MAECDHTTVWHYHLEPLLAPKVESERAALAALYVQPGDADLSGLVAHFLQDISCGVVTPPSAPTLTTVTPNTGTQGTTVTVDITGTNFVDGATTVEVSGTGVLAGNIHVLSSGTLRADIAIAALATAGVRALTVRNAGGSSSSQSFTVAGTDPAFASVVLLIGAETAVVDESPAARTLTLVGNAARTTAQARYGTASMTFDGTGDWVQWADSADFSFGLGDLTIEGWFRFLVKTTSQALLGQWDGTTPNNSWFAYLLSNTLTFRIANGVGGFFDIAGPFIPTLGQWYHLAMDRSGLTWRLYVDGVVLTTLTPMSQAFFDSPLALTLGAIGPSSGFSSFDLNGQVDEVRITKGVARYNGAFTPPTAAFPRA